jgi:hypothetical protein
MKKWNYKLKCLVVCRAHVLFTLFVFACEKLFVFVLCMVVPNTYCVVLFFPVFFFFFFGFVCLCLVICVPSVASSSGLSILECPFGFCNVYLRNKSWKPECVLSFNMGWRILVNCIPRLWLGINLEARDKL